MNKKETIKKLKNWAKDTDKVRDYHIIVSGEVEYDEENDVEFLAVETDSKSVLYGLILLLESYSGLKFYGVRTRCEKLQILLSFSNLI
jgi:hypothetical protein